MDISKLPLELVVGITEHMEVATIRNFMTTSKQFHSLTKIYQLSICTAKLERFDLRPPGNVLSSAGIERHVVKPGTFDLIQELELRQGRIETILSNGYIDLSSPPGLKPLTPTQQNRFAAVLERALWRCDAISDVAANIEGGAVPEYNYTLISSGYWNLAGSLPVEIQQHNPFTNAHARDAQIEYLRSLPLDDLAGLYLLITSVSVGHVRDRPAIQGDPNFAERVTVFEECTLRHGTWFLWAQASDENKKSKHMSTDITLREMTGHMLLAGFAELIGWETGADLPPGLRMSLLDAAKGHLKDHEQPVVFHLYRVIRKLIFGVDQVDDDDDDDDNDDDEDRE